MGCNGLVHRRLEVYGHGVAACPTMWWHLNHSFLDSLEENLTAVAIGSVVGADGFDSLAFVMLLAIKEFPVRAVSLIQCSQVFFRTYNNDENR